MFHYESTTIRHFTHYQFDVSPLFSACPGKGVARGKTRTGATLMVFPLAYLSYVFQSKNCIVNQYHKTG